MSMNLKDLDDAEKFQKHFVTPLVEQIRTELSPLVKASQDHEARLVKLESNQKKALLGYAGIVAVVTGGWHYVKAKYLSNFFK